MVAPIFPQVVHHEIRRQSAGLRVHHMAQGSGHPGALFQAQPVPVPFGGALLAGLLPVPGKRPVFRKTQAVQAQGPVGGLLPIFLGQSRLDESHEHGPAFGRSKRAPFSPAFRRCRISSAFAARPR